MTSLLLSSDLGSMDSWNELKEAMSNRVNEIRRSTYLCIEEKSANLFVADLTGLDASVKALERQIVELRARLKHETETIPKVEALLKACRDQETDLHTIAANLPPHLPSIDAPAQGANTTNKRQGGTAMGSQAALAGDDMRAGRQWDTTNPTGVHTTGDAGTRAAPRSRAAPRWCVREDELAGVAAYMRGRLTLDKVNAALEELAALADANMKLMAAAKQSNSRLSGPERKKATELMHLAMDKDTLKGKPWFLEADVGRDGVNIKLDKTGRSILTVLRHLARLQEVRCTWEGASTTAFIMQYPS